MNQKEVLDRFSKFISFPTLSHDGDNEQKRTPFIEMANFMQIAFPNVHKAMTREKVCGEGASLIYKWKSSTPSGKLPFAILAHMDVVPVESPESWTHPPFAGHLDGEYIWGRGSNDDKCSVAGVLEACEDLITAGFAPTRDIYLLFGHNEEDTLCKNSGASAIAHRLKEEGVSLDFVWDEGGAIITDPPMGLTNPAAMIGLAEKGFANVMLKVTGSGGHAAEPPKNTAFGDLSNLLAMIQNNPMKARLIPTVEQMLNMMGKNINGSLGLAMKNTGLFKSLVINALSNNNLTSAMVRSTIVPTMANIGTAHNVLPQEASANLNIRILPGDTIDDILNHINSLANKIGILNKISFEVTVCNEPLKETDINHPTYNNLSNVFKSINDDIIVVPYLVTGATDSRSYSDVTNQIFRIYPFALSQDEIAAMHATDERIKINSYLDGIEIYKKMIILENK